MMTEQPNTTTGTTLFSRPVAVLDLHELAAGDLVDVSTTSTPCWEQVHKVGTCADDPDEFGEIECDQRHEGVIFFAEPMSTRWHVSRTETVYARFTATVSQAEIEAENTQHAQAAAARYATPLPGIDTTTSNTPAE